MTVPQLEYFITLAQTLNYTKASEQLYLTQPHLSKTIANLEQEMGAQLFQRSRRDVSLTPAGAAFFEDLGQIMPSLNDAVRRARGVGEGYRGTVNLGYLGMAMARSVPVLIERFRAACPDININLHDYTYRPQMEALRQGEVDLAFMVDRELAPLAGLQKRHIASDDMCLVVNARHPLASREAVYLAEAEEEPFLLLDPKVSGRDTGLFSAMCLEQQVKATIAGTADSLNNLLVMVDCGMGVAVLARHMQQLASENTRFVRIRGYENYFRLVCAWRAGRNACVDRLLDVMDGCVLSMHQPATVTGQSA